MMIVLNPQKRRRTGSKSRRPQARNNWMMKRSIDTGRFRSTRAKRRVRSLRVSGNPFSFLNGIACCNPPTSFTAPATEGGGLTGNLIAGFSPNALMKVAPAAIGVFASGFVAGQIQSRIDPKWSSGWRNVVVGIGAAGATSALAGVIRKDFAAPVMAGAMARVVIQLLSPIFDSFTAPKAPTPVVVRNQPAPAMSGNDEEDSGSGMSGEDVFDADE